MEVSGGSGPAESSDRSPQPDQAKEGSSRRDLLTRVSSIAMAGGILGGYGAFAAIAGRFLYPPGPTERAWVYVAEVKKMKPGEAISFRTPGGAPVNVARQGETGEVGDFIALSSTCPHLGCQVHWEGHNDRFFCPCHNGVFDAQGKGIEGPPGDAGQSLLRYPLMIQDDLLFIEVPVEALAEKRPEGDGPEFAFGATKPGLDPCLFEPPAKGRDA